MSGRTGPTERPRRSVTPVAMPRRRAPVMALGVAAAAFLYQFLVFIGLTNDHYMHLAWAQQVRLGAVPGRDFVDPGMPLQYLLSAAVQALAPGPFSETLLAIGLLSLAAAGTAVLVTQLTGVAAIGVLSAVIQLLIRPRLYSYPKVLVPPLVLLCGLWYARRRDSGSRLLLAAAIGLAFLFRHDLGGYAALCGLVLALTIDGPVRVRLLEGLRLGLLTIALLLPYFAFVQWSEGLAQHVHNSLEFFGGESRELQFTWPVVRWRGDDGSLRWGMPEAAAFLFYVAYALPLVAGAILVRRWRSLDRVHPAVAAGAAAMIVGYDAIILREPLTVRVPDLAAILAILGAWCAAQLLDPRWSEARRRPARVAAAAVFAAALAVVIVSAGAVGEAGSQIESSRLDRGPAAMFERGRSVASSAREWPWARRWPSGELPDAIRYIAACTKPSDKLFVPWFAPEYYFFARRGFAGGHALLWAPSFSSAEDQAHIVARLREEQPPLAIVNEAERLKLEQLYPAINTYLLDRYRVVGDWVAEGGATISVLARRGWGEQSTYGPGAWPCDAGAAMMTASPPPR